MKQSQKKPEVSGTVLLRTIEEFRENYLPRITQRSASQEEEFDPEEAGQQIAREAAKVVQGKFRAG